MNVLFITVIIENHLQLANMFGMNQHLSRYQDPGVGWLATLYIHILEELIQHTRMSWFTSHAVIS